MDHEVLMYQIQEHFREESANTLKALEVAPKWAQSPCGRPGLTGDRDTQPSWAGKKRGGFFHVLTYIEPVV